MAIFNKETGVITGLEDWNAMACGSCPVNIYRGGLCVGKGTTLKRGSSDAHVLTEAKAPAEIAKVGTDGLCLNTPPAQETFIESEGTDK